MILDDTYRQITTMPALFASAPIVAFHFSFAMMALLSGPVALLSRKGSLPHRTAGYIWVVSMVVAALSSLWILDFRLPNIGGYTPIHILVLTATLGAGYGLYFARKRRISKHRRVMIYTYFLGCVTPGLFTLLPSRFLGRWLWGTVLGLL